MSNNVTLIEEKPSPNVTTNIPFAFDYIDLLNDSKRGKYICNLINGVYIFDPYDNYDALAIKTSFDEAFEFYSEKLYPVDVTGFKNVDGRIGSERFCTMSSSLANFFTKVIKSSNMLDIYNEDNKFIQVSKYFRAMKYKNGGEHYPHYDSDFKLNDQFITKMSLVCYGDNCDTGEIAFIKTNPDEETTQDWTCQADDSEIFLKVKPKIGRIVVFDHKVCHTVLPYTENKQRRVLRGDLIYSL